MSIEDSRAIFRMDRRFSITLASIRTCLPDPCLVGSQEILKSKPAQPKAANPGSLWE